MRLRRSRKLQRFLNRTGKFNCDICNLKTLLVQHHIKGREIENPHHKSNISNICASCHDKIHANLINVEGWHMTSEGLKLIWEENKNSKV